MQRDAHRHHHRETISSRGTTTPRASCGRTSVAPCPRHPSAGSARRFPLSFPCMKSLRLYYARVMYTVTRGKNTGSSISTTVIVMDTSSVHCGNSPPKSVSFFFFDTIKWMQKGVLSKKNKIISRNAIPNVFYDLTNYFFPFSLRNEYFILLFLHYRR